MVIFEELGLVLLIVTEGTFKRRKSPKYIEGILVKKYKLLDI